MDGDGFYSVPVYLIAEIKCEEEETNFKVEVFIFEDFSSAWQWMLDNESKIVGLTNPTTTPIHENKEVPTKERAERLLRYAHYIREEQVVPSEVST